MLMKDKTTKKTKTTIVIVKITLLILLVIGVILLSKLFQKEIYKPKSRVNNIKQEQKKEKNDVYKTMGWLRVQGTNIDTPIIKYLNEDSDELAAKNNYLWNLNDDEQLYNKVNIMGHNLLNLSSQPKIGLKHFSRFDDLMAFVYYDFVKDNKYIQYTIDGKDYIYKIYSVEFTKPKNLDIENDADYTKEKLRKYIKRSKENSIYNFSVRVTDKDKIISLITCTRMFGSGDDHEFVVNAKLVPKHERLVNYKVTKSKKYKKIEKILKGDVKYGKA